MFHSIRTGVRRTPDSGTGKQVETLPRRPTLAYVNVAHGLPSLKAWVTQKRQAERTRHGCCCCWRVAAAAAAAYCCRCRNTATARERNKTLCALPVKQYAWTKLSHCLWCKGEKTKSCSRWFRDRCKQTHPAETVRCNRTAGFNNPLSTMHARQTHTHFSLYPGGVG